MSISHTIRERIITKYYFAGGQRIAMRRDGELNFILSDHLGSTSLVTDVAGNVISETRYTAWGEERYNSGENPSDYTFTGQYSNMANFGLMFYNARWYDPAIAHFTQADTIIPDLTNPQTWNRYAYVNNNPVKFVDPSGHKLEDTLDGECDLDCVWSGWDIPDDSSPAVWGGNDGGRSGSGDRDGKATGIIDAILPDGLKYSITVSAGWGSGLYNTKGDKIPTVLYSGLSLVRDNYGGIQLFHDTLDIEFTPTLELGPEEQVQPSELFGAGISATKGFIWRTDEDVFVTSNYEGESRSSGGGASMFVGDYYQSFPNPNIKGVDFGLSAGSWSAWSISTKSKPISPRFDLTFWQYP